MNYWGPATYTQNLGYGLNTSRINYLTRRDVGYAFKMCLIHFSFTSVFTKFPVRNMEQGIIEELSLKVHSCKLCNNKYMIASTQITTTEVFAFIAVVVFDLLSRKVLFINRKYNRNC